MLCRDGEGHRVQTNDQTQEVEIERPKGQIEDLALTGGGLHGAWNGAVVVPLVTVPTALSTPSTTWKPVTAPYTGSTPGGAGLFRFPNRAERRTAMPIRPVRARSWTVPCANRARKGHPRAVELSPTLGPCRR